MTAGFLRRPTGRLICLGFGLVVIEGGALTIHVPGADTVGSINRANAFVGVLAFALLVYVLAVRLVLRDQLPRRALWTILGLAVLMRALLIPSNPFLSSDIYRYVWDGRVQAAGINPYLHIPADPVLSDLRDTTVYPLINRKDYARTIYPPAAQLAFAGAGRLAPGVLGMKLVMLALEAAGIVSVLLVLGLAGLPRERILIYAWNPLAVWSFACDGHVDAMGIGLLGLALLARARHRDSLAGSVLGAAALVKVLPIAVAPAFVRGGRLWRPLLAGAGTILVLYLPYVSAGWNLFGFVGGYGAEEGYATGGGYWFLAGLGHLGWPSSRLLLPYLLCAGLGLAALALRIAFGSTRAMEPDAVTLCRDTAILAAVATCAASPHYAWYYPWLALPAVVAPVPAVIWLGSAPLLFLIDPFNDRFLWPSLVFIPSIVLAGRSLWRARRSVALITQGAA